MPCINEDIVVLVTGNLFLEWFTQSQHALVCLMSTQILISTFIIFIKKSTWQKMTYKDSRAELYLIEHWQHFKILQFALHAHTLHAGYWACHMDVQYPINSSSSSSSSSPSSYSSSLSLPTWMTWAICWEKMSKSWMSLGIPGPSSLWANWASLGYKLSPPNYDFLPHFHLHLRIWNPMNSDKNLN